jgi:23S rRNA pseudouridine1911/1915/1917 synthase
VPTRRSQRVETGDVIELSAPPLQSLGVEPQPIPIDIVHQDQDICIVNKPQGLVVHPNTNDLDGTLVNGLLHWVKDLSGINGVERPGIVHRIDKDTSGLLVVAKHDQAHRHLGLQFRAHSIDRLYVALLWGAPIPGEGVVQGIIGRHPTERRKMSGRATSGKFAVTHYRVVEDYGPVCLVACSLETGRTHQIRVHMGEILRHPVVGDPVYGGLVAPRRLFPDPKVAACLRDVKGQMLHAATLGFFHPRDDRYVFWKAPPPEPMAGLIRSLRESVGTDPLAPGPWDEAPRQGWNPTRMLKGEDGVDELDEE